MRIPTYRRHSSGQARVTINGRDHLLGPYGSRESREKYGRLIAEYSAAGNSESFGVATEARTIGQVMLDYVTYAKGYYQGSTEWENIRLALRPISELYGSSPAKDFGPEQYKAVRQWWLQDDRRSRQYVNKQMARAKRFVKWAVGEGMIPPAQYTAIQCVAALKKNRTQARESKPILPVDAETVNATIPHLTAVVADMVRFQQLTGCRPGELVRLTPAMVDRIGEVWTAVLADHKTSYRGKDRTIYIGPKAQAVLRPYLLRDQHAACFSPQESETQRLQARSEARTTPENEGNRPGYSKRARLARKPRKAPGASYTSGTYARAIRYACLRAWPVPKGSEPEEATAHRAKVVWAPNQLRHAAATEIRRQYGLEAAQVILGHSELGVTQVYAERDRSKAVEVALKIG